MIPNHEQDERSDDPAGGDVFRLSRRVLYVGLAGLALFGGMGIFSVVFALSLPADRRIPLLCFFLASYGAFTGLAIWVLLAYWRERLVLRPGEISVRDLYRWRTVRLAVVTEINWCTLSGAIVLHTPTAKLRFYLQNYISPVRLRVVAGIRRGCPHVVQTNWVAFCLRNSRTTSSESRPLAADEIRLTRRRWAWYFGPATVLAAGIGVLNWWFTGEVRVLIAGPIVIVMIWGLLTGLTSKLGMVARHDPSDTQFLWVFLSWWLLSLVGFAWFQYLLRTQSGWRQWLAWLAFLTVALLLSIWKAKPLIRRRKQSQESRQIEAMTEWERVLAAYPCDSGVPTEKGER